MAIDYGTKRCGIAVTDPTQTIASALDTIPTHKLINFLQEYIGKERVDLVVFGNPKHLDNRESETSKLLAIFLRQFAEKLPGLPYKTYDERFTSALAYRSLVESGQPLKVRKDKSVLDKISATILLQDYLNSVRNSI